MKCFIPELDIALVEVRILEGRIKGRVTNGNWFFTLDGNEVQCSDEYGHIRSRYKVDKLTFEFDFTKNTVY